MHAIKKRKSKLTFLFLIHQSPAYSIGKGFVMFSILSSNDQKSGFGSTYASCPVLPDNKARIISVLFAVPGKES
jgi:hypothetical protein